MADPTNVDQCINLGSPNNHWVTGSVNAAKAHYVEGDSVPYRDIIGGLSVGVQYTFEIEWDVTQGGKHALDYITSFDRTEDDADPCSDLGFGTGCENTPDSTIAIPADPFMTSQPDWGGAQEAGLFSLWGGTLDGTSGYDVRSGSGSGLDGSGVYVSNASTAIQVTFTVDNISPGR